MRNKQFGAPNLNNGIGSQTGMLSTKLPKLELRKFNGDLHDWIPFWEQFKSAIHENQNLDAATKFNYLQTLLTGKAADSIAGFTPTYQCYKDAIEILINQYGSTDRIVDKLMQSLLATKVIQDKDVTALRNLLNKTKAALRFLQALGVPTIHYALMTKSVILRCIPNNMRHDFFKSKLNVDLNKSGSKAVESSLSGIEQIEKLLGYLTVEVEALEKTNDTSTRTEVKRAD